MDGSDGTERQQQHDALVGTAREALITDLIGWKTDVPSGRLHPIRIDIPILHAWCIDRVKPIIQQRLHKIKRFNPDRQDAEVLSHSAALATHFVKCCYQHMRESAKIRFSGIVRTYMQTDLQLVRTTLPLPLARIVTGLGPVTVKSGHLAPATLVPYTVLGTNFGLTVDGDNPWNEDPTTTSSAIAAFRVNPELRLAEVDFTRSEGSAFWTVYSAHDTSANLSDGFCCLPEDNYTEVDKVLALLINQPLFVLSDVTVINYDWSTSEADLPNAWSGDNEPPNGIIIVGHQLREAHIQYRGTRLSHGRVELLAAQVVSRQDHQIIYVGATGPQPGPSDTQMVEASGTPRAKRTRTTSSSGDTDPDVQGEPTLLATTKKRIRVGYALFYGCSHTGASAYTVDVLWAHATGLL